MLFFCIDPKYSYNGEPWTKIGFGPYSCHIHYFSSLFDCNELSSSLKYSLSYCDPSKDTVTLQCSPTQGSKNVINFHVR